MGLREDFQCDSFNRLTQSTISPAGPPVKTLAYDANGNQTAGLGRTIGYTVSNKPNSIMQGTTLVAFTYGPDGERLTRSDTIAGGTTVTTYVAGGPVMAEKVTGSGGAVTWNEYLMAAGEMIGVRFNNVTNPGAPVVTTRYFHKDHLGSIAVLTDESAAVVQRLSYDPWGKQRNPTTWADDTAGNLPSQDQTTRGFTGQEQLNDVGLVHMNGRVYDPTIGRFLSADPFVDDPFNAQALNRYTYVYDNPLSFTDPSGFGFFDFIFAPFIQPFKVISNFIRHNPEIAQIIGIIATAVSAYFCGPCSIGVAFAVAAFNTGVTTGKIGLALKAGLIAGAEAAALYGVGAATAETITLDNGTGFDTFTTHDLSFGSISHLENIAGHAVVGCAFSVASGGECGPAALAGGITSFAGPLINHNGFAVGLVANTVLGGLASVAGGGKFANGAITAAFGYIFNAGAESANSKSGIYPDDPVQAKLQGYADRAVAEFDALGDAGFSDAQLDALKKDPWLRPAYRGYNIDQIVRGYLNDDPELSRLTGKINLGVDLVDPKTGFKYEMTTEGQFPMKNKKIWARHASYQHG